MLHPEWRTHVEIAANGKPDYPMLYSRAADGFVIAITYTEHPEELIHA
jgi:hypothetical protein